MRILILTASLPYPTASGGAIRAYGILRGLHAAGHTITLMTFAPDNHPIPPQLSAICQHIITQPEPTRSKSDRIKTLALSNQADIARRLYSESFARELTTLISQQPFDLIQFEGIEIACYLPLVKQIHPNLPCCFDTFNAEATLQKVIAQIDRQQMTRLPMAFYSTIQSQRIHQYEGDLCRMADILFAVSQEDAVQLQQYTPDKPIHIIPSGINVSDYTKSYAVQPLPANSLVFTGKMDYRPNVDAMLWFTQTVLPDLPAAHLVIVGQQPHPRLQPLMTQSNITLTGWVDSVLPYLQAADVYIAPLRMGSGTRLKLLEAMASRCAIVATDTAAAGLSPAARATMTITDDPQQMAQSIQHLLNHPDQRQQMGETAYQAVLKSYDWSQIIPRLLTIYQEAGLGT